MSDEIKKVEEPSSEPAQKSEAPKEDAKPEERRPAQRSDQRGDQRNSRPGSNQSDRKPRRVPRFRKKVCKFCHNKDVAIDYKKPDVLERFLTERGKILPRRITGTCSKHQRRLASEVKRARMIALLPFVEL
ncbi:MAG: 30S ribosomal protein S18 [Spirochaetes bacterium]|jgi:small subunit ribosomal protein S18|nr:30S ribosomal protein S18 [Spirochaetota bacterium]